MKEGKKLQVKKMLFILVAALCVGGFFFYFFKIDNAPPKNLIIYFFDVGQGDAALIRTPEGENILIDGGPDNTLIKRLGQVLPYFDRDIDLMILTHPHADHVAGLVEVLDRYHVEKVLTTGVAYGAPEYRDWLEKISAKNISTLTVTTSQEIYFSSSTKFFIFWPRESLVDKEIENINNASISGQLTYGDNSFLFTGDLEDEELIDKNIDLHSDVYKVGHHGSNTANDKEFLERVSPDYVIISVGQDNKFGLPDYRAIKYLERLGARIWRTDENGEVVVESDGRNLSIESN